MKRTDILYIINVLLLVFSLIVMITGIIKFPGLLQFININPFSLPQAFYTALHDWLGLAIVGLTLLHVILHWNWLSAMTKKIWKSNRFFIPILAVLILIPLAIIRARTPGDITTSNVLNQAEENISANQTPSVEDLGADLSATAPLEPNEIGIEGIGNFKFDPALITSVRNDIFNTGYFSLFDILVHLHETGQLDLVYFFSEAHDTHMIESINGIENWWYVAYYDGGWPERNVWRMDLYPYKDRTVFQLVQVSDTFLNLLHGTFAEEVQRLGQNNGAVIIPEVVIRTREAKKLIFNDVEVYPSDLRQDYFADGTITAVDVIIALGVAGEISYKLNWYESIGSAGIVKDYFVDAINQDHTYDRCGFVYETGSKVFYGFDGNHIHIASDLRVLTSPEYVEFFWICI